MHTKPCGTVDYPVTEIGTWAHSASTAEETSHDAGFWDRDGLSRGELMVLMADGLDPEYAIVAVTDPDIGDTVLADGCHRYAVARDLGLARSPVRWAEWADWFD